MYPRFEVFGIAGLPEFHPGDEVGTAIVDAANRQNTPLRSDDILVVTQKIVSKAEDRVVDLRDVEPSPLAERFADVTGKDPRLVELVLQESQAIVRMDPERGILITETRHGFVCANSGIDASNIPGDGVVALLPEDSDRSARAIRDEIGRAAPGTEVAVIISDTFGRAWRDGHVNFAIGASGIEPIKDYVGTIDATGKELHVTRIAVADELAATAELVTAKSINVPVAVVRGYPHERSETGVAALLRDRSRDMFR